MASPTFSVENVLASLRSPGFYSEADPEVGERASEQFHNETTEPGLKFFEDNFVKNERIAGVLKALFPHCYLIAYRKFANDPTRVFQFRRGGAKADGEIVVLLWPPGSEVIYYSDSLSHDTLQHAVTHDNGLWRVAEAALAKLGKGTRIPLKQGGLTIHDGRTLVTFHSGRPIAASFAGKEFLKKWDWTMVKRRVEFPSTVEGIRQ
ncbi:hypothetical protein NKR19_g9197 [Coniochaeta hoffmannii]|uniref:Uncharacterized protein n=1 Tax=Coniochaeta hoffmannii TaxID=91930 RepID=A0AA38R3L3_9PEZI|nr:hypothetical protein NKR19_g9197 [Coniochaeta hoffmannii]